MALRPLSAGPGRGGRASCQGLASGPPRPPRAPRFGSDPPWPLQTLWLHAHGRLLARAREDPVGSKSEALWTLSIKGLSADSSVHGKFSVTEGKKGGTAEQKNAPLLHSGLAPACRASRHLRRAALSRNPLISPVVAMSASWVSEAPKPFCRLRAGLMGALASQPQGRVER